jgi:hypothetical protein
MSPQFAKLVPICYPYYLVTDENDNFFFFRKLSVAALDPVPSESTDKAKIAIQAYQDALKALPIYSSTGVPDFVTEYQTEMAGKVRRLKLHSIQETVHSVWDIFASEIGQALSPYSMLPL